MSFEIVTDSGANLTSELIEKYNITVIPMYVRSEGGDFFSYSDYPQVNPAELYRRMSEENAAYSTSAPSIGDALEKIEPLVKAGNDVLYIGFSSGLSSTYQNICTAINELKEEYPERKMFSCDSLCASMGQGMLVTLAARKRESGADIDTVCAYVEEIKLKIVHYFTVDTFKFLHKGGRISAAGAVVGTLLDIKPMLHVNDLGKLVALDKVRGMKAALKKMADQVKNHALADPELPIYIVHGNCLARAQELADKVIAAIGNREIVINDLDLAIGSHSGPGTLSIFFVGSNR